MRQTCSLGPFLHPFLVGQGQDGEVNEVLYHAQYRQHSICRYMWLSRIESDLLCASPYSKHFIAKLLFMAVCRCMNLTNF